MAQHIKDTAKAARTRFAGKSALDLLLAFDLAQETAQLPDRLVAAFAQLAGVEVGKLQEADKALLLLLVGAIDRVGAKRRATSPLLRVLQLVLYWRVHVPPQAFDILAKCGVQFLLVVQSLRIDSHERGRCGLTATGSAVSASVRRLAQQLKDTYNPDRRAVVVTVDNVDMVLQRSFALSVTRHLLVAQVSWSAAIEQYMAQHRDVIDELQSPFVDTTNDVLRSAFKVRWRARDRPMRLTREIALPRAAE